MDKVLSVCYYGLTSPETKGEIMTEIYSMMTPLDPQGPPKDEPPPPEDRIVIEPESDETSSDEPQ